MKNLLSMYEGTSFEKAKLIMTDERTKVLARKKERDISRRCDKNIKRCAKEVPESTEKYDKGKGGSMWENYNGRHTGSAAKLV